MVHSIDLKSRYDILKDNEYVNSLDDDAVIFASGRDGWFLIQKKELDLWKSAEKDFDRMIDQMLFGNYKWPLN